MKVMALVLAFGVAGACGGKSGSGDDPGMAAGVASKREVLALWQRLSLYKASYLRSWSGALADPDPSPRDVLDAWNELGFAVTGPGGFWRKTVPESWFGCTADAGSAPCRALSAASDNELKAWDAFQADIGKVTDGQELQFLAKNQKKMTDYLDTWVPEAPSMSPMKATGFYKEKLDKAMGVTASEGNDL